MFLKRSGVKGESTPMGCSTGDKNLGETANSLGGILKMQFYLDKWKTWTEICKRIFNKVTLIGRNENRGFNWAKSSFSNTAKQAFGNLSVNEMIINHVSVLK